MPRVLARRLQRRVQRPRHLGAVSRRAGGGGVAEDRRAAAAAAALRRGGSAPPGGRLVGLAEEDLAEGVVLARGRAGGGWKSSCEDGELCGWAGGCKCACCRLRRGVSGGDESGGGGGDGPPWRGEKGAGRETCSSKAHAAPCPSGRALGSPRSNWDALCRQPEKRHWQRHCRSTSSRERASLLRSSAGATPTRWCTAERTRTGQAGKRRSSATGCAASSASGACSVSQRAWSHEYSNSPAPSSCRDEPPASSGVVVARASPIERRLTDRCDFGATRGAGSGSGSQ